MNKFIKTLLISSALACVTQSYTVQADDTELYVLNVSQTNGVRPKILIILDNSGSMMDYVTPYFSYDNSMNYVPSNNSYSLNKYSAFFSNNSLPGMYSYDRNGVRSFSFSSGIYKNNCNASYLSTFPYVGKFRSPNASTWNNSPQNNQIIDCKADADGKDTINPATGDIGYPANNASHYATSGDSSSNFTSSLSNQNLFSVNYLYYRTKLTSAKQAVKDIIESTYDEISAKTNMDFGLEIFNCNSTTCDGSSDTTKTNNNGGRIIKAVSQLTASDKTNLFTSLDSLDGTTYTPLAESMWEAYKYLSGSSVVYGDNSTLPARDLNALTSVNTSTYKSPLADDCADDAYVILVTDGDPTNDTAANGSKTTKNSIIGLTQNNTADNDSYLPVLTEWMNQHDIMDNVDGRANKAGTQHVTTYTVSFGSGISDNGKAILTNAAKRGGGAYYNAADASDLSAAMNSIIKDIAARQFTMSAPSTASSNVDKTQYLDNLYMTGFVPGKGPFWGGNLKKLKYTSTGIKDANSNLALDSNGRLLSTAKTYWSSSADGNAIAKGGVQEMLAGLTTARTIYTDTNTTSPSLTALSSANFTSTQQKLDLGLLSTASATDVATMIDWIKGVDTDSVLATKPNRATIMGDMMHSKPLVINYGASTADGTPDLRILAGTNSGFLHMFKDAGDTVSETWTYIPYPLLKNQITLKTASIAVDHVSGIDGSPVSYVVDKNNDGKISNSTTGDKAWMFVGQRQGGRSYYALNVTNPDSPSLKWIITNTTTGFSRLGQTWSTPQIAKIPGYKDNDGNYKPVLVFAGGYDVNKDAKTIGTNDSTGNAIYFVDADTRALIFSVSPDASSATNLNNTAMLDSIPSDVTLFDSNGDGLTDRLYVGDTGGNVWRMDLPGTDKSKWSIFKFAKLGSDDTIADDRRFFGAPIIVRTINPKLSQLADGTYKYTQQPYDAVMLGSGDRNKPSSEKTVKNGYFMIRDMHPAVYGETETKPTDASAIDVASLYDITGNKIGTIASTGPTAAQKTEIIKLTSSKKGWVYWMTANSGEKVFGSGFVSNGILNFTSFIPEGTTVGANQCSLGASIGTTRLYSIDMTYGYYTGLTAYTSTNDLLIDNLGSYVDSTGKVVGLGLPGGSLVSGNDTNGVAKCAAGQSCIEVCTSATGCTGQTPTTGNMLPQKEYQYTHETN
jgi:type IV pilus assembly protein PilY1